VHESDGMKKLTRAACIALGATVVFFAGCGIGNIFTRSTGTTGFDEERTQAGESTPVPRYRVQIGMFDTQADAEDMAASVRPKTDHPVYVVYIPPFYRVRIGDFAQVSDAEESVDFLRREGFSDARYVYISAQ